MIIFLTGIIIGSFLNVCIYRIPIKKSIVYPSSNCPKCNVYLKWYDLIPILSYVFQKGRCRYCEEIISSQYPLVEALNGLLYMIFYIKFGLTMEFIFYAILSSVLVIISFIDFEYGLIPKSLNILIFILTVLYKILGYLLYNTSLNLINSLFGLIISSGIFLIIIIVSKGGLGGGDMKLIGVLGFALGIKKILLNIVLSFIFGGIISGILLLLKIKGRKDRIAFGPFISIAFIVTTLWGMEIINWYI